MVILLTKRPQASRPVVLAFLVLWVSTAPARDDTDAKQRLDFMQAAVESLEPDSMELKSKAALTFASKPILRYNDPTRSGSDVVVTNYLLDAGIWRLGAEGRPTALVTVELYEAPKGLRVVAYEFLSMTEKKFSLKHKVEKKIHWEPSESGLTMKDVPDAPKPAGAVAARLTQMRKLAQRFAATETFNGETVDCRLMANPIDRYQSEVEKIVDGAIFALANGTNPEIGILFETEGEHWRYGILRMCGAEASVTLDGKGIVNYARFDGKRRTDWPYFNDFYKIQMSK